MEANFELARCGMKITGLAPPFVQRFYGETTGQEVRENGL
jgi:hypothetical protein